MTGDRGRQLRSRRAASATAAALVLAGVLGACGGEDAGGGATDVETHLLTDTTITTTTDITTDTETDTTTATDVVTDTAVTTETLTRDDDVSADDGETDVPFPADTATDTGEPSGGPVLFTDLRIGRHEGFDRVVWEFAGDGRPGWEAGYTDDPREQGSGFAVEMPGDATLEVRMTAVGYPGDVEVPDGVEFYDGPRIREARATELVTQVDSGILFEGILQSFVGVEDQVPFRVYLLTDPTRVVLEVRAP